MSELTRKEKEELLFGLRCHSAPEVESTFIIMATKIKRLEHQLAEAIETAANAVEKWRDTADSYGVYYGEIELEEIKLKQLKEQGE